MFNLLQKKISFIKFWWHAHNAHGIHSPFVYQLVTESLYSQNLKKYFNSLEPKKKYFKTAKLILRLIKYFEFDTIYSDSCNSDNIATAFKISDTTHNSISSKLPPSENHPFIYIQELNTFYLDFLSKILQNPPLHLLILIDNIRFSKNSLQNWKELVQHPRVVVSIDLFAHGIIIVRPGQVKEHFNIRP